jgi:hypothetical protein
MTARAVLYKKLLKQSAKELRCRTSDERAKNYAVLKLTRELISARLINGKDVDPSALRWLSEELEKYAPAAVPASVQLSIQPVSICARCKCEIDREPDPPLPSVALPVPSSAPVEAKSEAAPKPLANVVPLKRSVRDGALLKR